MFNPDVPIQTASDDVLGRHSFAEQLARAMINYNSPEAFTIGLYGPWGSGKTSVINLLEEELAKQSRDCIVVRFNPWMCSTPDQMIAQFFGVLAEAINPKSSGKKIETIQEQIELAQQTVELLSQYANMAQVTQFDPKMAAVNAGLNIFGRSIQLFQKFRKSKLQEPTTLQGQKQTLQDKLRVYKKKIIVMVDDLDRLSSDEIVAVFQLVKSLADFPYMIYLLAFDRDIVVEALDKVQKNRGDAYLEKIVQVPFELPQINHYDIAEVFLNRLCDILSDSTKLSLQGKEWTQLFYYGISPFLSSIRDVIRYTNILALKYESLKDEADAVDFIAATCIQVFQPEIYHRLPSYERDLCGEISGWSSTNAADMERLKSIYESLLQTVAPDKQTAVEFILKVLFPKLSQAIKGSIVPTRYYNTQQQLLHHSISSPKYFNLYFGLRLSDNMLPKSLVRRLIFDIDEEGFFQYIKHFVENDKVVSFTDELNAYSALEKNGQRVISSDRAEALAYWICEIWEYIAHECGWNQEQNYSRWMIAGIINQLLQCVLPEKRKDCLDKIFNAETVNETTIYEILRDLEISYGRFIDQEPDLSAALLPLDDIKELEDVFAERSIKRLENGTLIDDENAKIIFWLLERIDLEKSNLSRVRSAMSQYLSNNVFLAKLIAIHVFSGIGIRKSWKIDVKEIDRYVNREEAVRRIGSMLSSDETNQLSDIQKRMNAVFLLEVELLRNNANGPITEDMIDKKLNDMMIH